jgi:hypothetical protein
MLYPKTLLGTLCLLLVGYSNAQTSTLFKGFTQVYPIADRPSINTKTTMVKNENIILEGNPIVHYSFYNDFVSGLMSGKKYTKAYYLDYRPQLRIYDSESLPVKMPTYRLLLGMQHLFKTKNDNLYAISLESGHYSNGQSGCTFDHSINDRTAACDSVYSTITKSSDLSKMLNRIDGNFSTNLTEVVLSYRHTGRLVDDAPDKINRIEIGATRYHNLLLGLIDAGGFQHNDIKIYGRMRYHFEYEYSKFIFTSQKWRVSFAENFEWIQGAHKSVNPMRTVTTFTLYQPNQFGYFVSAIYGHDNYNIRFVDSGFQTSIGVTWNTFPTFKIRK